MTSPPRTLPSPRGQRRPTAIPCGQDSADPGRRHIARKDDGDRRDGCHDRDMRQWRHLIHGGQRLAWRNLRCSLRERSESPDGLRLLLGAEAAATPHAARLGFAVLVRSRGGAYVRPRASRILSAFQSRPAASPDRRRVLVAIEARADRRVLQQAITPSIRRPVGSAPAAAANPA